MPGRVPWGLLVVPGLILLVLAVSGGATAHACYFTDEGAGGCEALDPDPGALARGVTHPLVALFLVGSLLAPFAALLAWRAAIGPRFRDAWARMHGTLMSYEDLLPALLRISLGIALASAGAAGYFFSPLEAGTLPRAYVWPLQILGFMFLFGLLVRVAAVLTIGMYAWGIAGGVAVPHFLLGVSEIPGAALAILIFGGGRPGLDHLVQRTLDPDRQGFGALLTGRPGVLGRATSFTPLILRLTLATTLAYGAFTEKLLNPHVGMQVAADYGLTWLLPAEGWVALVGTVELYIAALLVVGFVTRPVAVAAFLVLTATMLWFGESLASHITLFGAASWLFVTGAGRWSVDRRLNPEAGGGGSRLRDVPRAVPD